MWPPLWPDPTPGDYFLWEKRVNATDHPNRESLNASITETLETAKVVGVCGRFRSHLEALIKVNGNYFE